MKAKEPDAARRERAPEVLRDRFAQRLREVLPAGELVMSRPVHDMRAKSGDGQIGGGLTWRRADQVMEFECRVDLIASLTAVRALPEVDLHALPVPVLLAPRLTVRSRLQLERAGWSYFTGDGTMLVQHLEPLIVIRVTALRPVVGDRRARPAHVRRIADPRGQ